MIRAHVHVSLQEGLQVLTCSRRSIIHAKLTGKCAACTDLCVNSTLLSVLLHIASFILFHHVHKVQPVPGHYIL